jgi:toxin HigB-1
LLGDSKHRNLAKNARVWHPKFKIHHKVVPTLASDRAPSMRLLDTRNVTRCASEVIRSIRHKGLKRLYANGDPRGEIIGRAEKWRDIPARLDAAGDSSDMDLPVFRLHSLEGGLKGFWAVTVRANW